MLFHYLVKDKKGRLKEGDIDKLNLKLVLDHLAGQGFKILSVKPLALRKVGERKFIIFQDRLTISDKVFLMKYLSLMLRVGTDLFQAIDILMKDFDSGPVRRFLFEVRGNLEKGKPFWFTFSQHPEYFSPVTVNLIKAGEVSGNLESTLNKISINLERDKDLQGQVKASLVYPVILLVGSYFMALFLATFAIPKLGQVFMGTGNKIPAFTRFVLTTGTFLNNYVFVIVPLSIAIPVGLYFYFIKTKKGKVNLMKFVEKIPPLRNLMDKMALERFASVFSSLMKAGMPIIKALEVTAKAVGHPKFEAALIRIAHDDLAKGLGIGDSFRKEIVFPATVSNLLAIGEKAGHTEEILETLSTFYAKEIRVSLKTLVSFLEPALLVIIGVIVGGIALSLIVPIYQLVGQF